MFYSYEHLTCYTLYFTAENMQLLGNNTKWDFCILKWSYLAWC